MMQLIRNGSNNRQMTATRNSFRKENTDNVNIGMSVELPTEPGKKVTVMDVFFSNAQGSFMHFFL